LPVSAPAGVTWNPADKGAQIALSGGNLTAAFTSQSNYVSSLVRATSPISGKKYFRIKFNSLTGTDILMAVGVCLSTVAVTANADSAVGCTVYRANGSGAATSATLSAQMQKDGAYAMDGPLAFVANDILDIAVDTAVGMWVRLNGTGNWNASSGRSPVTGVGGGALPAGTLYPVASGYNGPSYTAFFADDGSGTLPSGYSWVG
jgi:hypothetical protein